MQELVVKHKFDLVSNMDAVKDSIAKEIAKYDVIIEEDKLPDAKHLMALFNKDKKEFSATCKKFIDSISEPITQFKASQKEIEKMYDEGREKIADQVTKFEAKKLFEIEDLIFDYASKACFEKGFLSTDVINTKDLVMLSAVSGASLTKKTKDAIQSRIQLVENEILKARLEAEEKAKRDRDIAEQARIEAEERMRQREINQAIEFEQQKQAAIQKAEKEKQDALDRAQQREIEFEAEKQQAIKEALKPKIESTHISDNGQKIFVLSARFEVSAPWNMDSSKIAASLYKKLSDAEFKTLVKVECLN